MTVSPAFFRSASALRLLERAAAVVSVPVALHYCSTPDEELHIMGWGGCEACQWVNDRDKGAEACRASRSTHSTLACAQDVPVSFVCHLGFACVSAPPLAADDYRLTFGPYIPAEAAEAIAYDIAQGLEALGVAPADADPLPFQLNDIRIAPVAAISATLEWLIEGLRELYKTYDAAADDVEAAAAPEVLKPARESQPIATTISQDIEPAIVALALLCGRSRYARAALDDALDEAALAGPQKQAPLQALLIQKTSSILDAAQRMGGDVERAWQKFPAFVAAIRTCEEIPAMIKKAMGILRLVHPVQEGRGIALPHYLPKVVDDIFKNHAADIHLTGIAANVGIAPSSITRVLEYRTGAGFSEFLGRVRMAQARRLLRNTQLSAARIGKRVGIDDQSNFSKLFVRYTGCTPGAYRRQFRPDLPISLSK